MNNSYQTSGNLMGETTNMPVPARNMRDITVEIKRFFVAQHKSRKPKGKYGIVLHINGETTELYFGSTEATMVYVCTLLKQHENERFYLSNLKIRTKYMRDNDREIYNWVKSVYNVLFPHPTKCFEEWYSKLYVPTDQLPGHPIYQGKSQCNRVIDSELALHPELKACFAVQTKGRSNKMYYEINLPARARIIVSNDLCDALDNAMNAA